MEKYDFENNINLNSIIKILYKFKYEILYQIMNYENKIIGLMVFHQNSNFFVPCYPSVYEPDNNIELKFMDDPEITYSNYEDTKMFLEKL